MKNAYLVMEPYVFYQKMDINSSKCIHVMNLSPLPLAPQQQSITISKDTIKRLVKDVKEMMKSPLTAHGIHYKHNNEDMLCGQAMIIGPSDTPYEQGYYFFDFKFPPDYPHSPPVVTYYTNDGVTRFNPNLYKNGKVCLSILNTWKGDQWSGCQSISSILLALCTVLNSEPFLNEPGMTKKHVDFNKYNSVLTYKNFQVAIVKMIRSDVIKERFPDLHQIMMDDFILNYEKIMKLFIKNYSSSKDIIHVTCYKMNCYIDYLDVKNELESLYGDLTSKKNIHQN
jgi:ubiquitin-protein ligase